MFNLSFLSGKNKSKEGFVEVTGGKIWYSLSGKGEGTPLIVVHGGPGFPHDALTSLEKLGDERQVILYDQLGCGNSDRPTDTSLWKIERFVEELELLISHLKLSEFHVLGHSWGGLVVAEFALRKPKGLKSIILASPTLSVPIWLKDAEKNIQSLPENIRFILTHREYYLSKASKEYEVASLEYYKNFLCRVWPFPDVVMKAYEKTNYDIYHYVWGPEEFIIDGTLIGYDITPRLHEIKIPVLLTAGEYDEVSEESLLHFEKLIPNAKIEVVQNTSHMPHVEAPDEYVRVLREFL